MTRTETILVLRDRGLTWHEIAKQLGVSYETARRGIDPEYTIELRARDRAKRERARRKETAIKLMPMPRSIKPPADDIAARLAEIPPDTRDLTGVICGDPLPGRSALAMKRQEQGA